METKMEIPVVMVGGEQIVWCVFNNDGCECSDFIGVFATQEAAEKVATRIRTGILGYNKLHLSGEWMGSVVVEQRSMNSFWLPGEVEHFESEARS